MKISDEIIEKLMPKLVERACPEDFGLINAKFCDHSCDHEMCLKCWKQALGLEDL